jgi:hypothetical protein
MANDTIFQVICDAIVNAHREAHTGNATRQSLHEVDADHYARAVLVALDHNGFKIIRATEEPDVD